MIDFLIIGGGIAGISLAARLSHLGKVTLLEAEEATGYHASGRSAAMFEETYGQPSTVALNQASKAYHMSANGGVLSPRGLMLVGTEDDAEAFQRDVSTMKMHGISLDDARAMVPVLGDQVRYVAHHSEAWDIDTDFLMQNFLREARSNGAAVLTSQRVARIERTAIGWNIATRTDEFSARLLINAAGAWADGVARLAKVAPLGITPFRRSMARVRTPEGMDVSGWPMMFGPGETWYAKPDAGQLLISPAEETPVDPHDAWAEDETLAEGIARFEAISTFQVTRLLSSWAGLRSFAPDRNLVIGFDPGDAAFFWQAGQGGYGFQTSPAASQVGADLIAGRTPDIGRETAKTLSPSRFS